MKFDHKVKYNGKWYMPFEEISEVVKSASEFSQQIDTPNQLYTKTEINRMPTAELKLLAKEQGIDNVESATGTELKKTLIKKLGL